MELSHPRVLKASVTETAVSPDWVEGESVASSVAAFVAEMSTFPSAPAPVVAMSLSVTSVRAWLCTRLVAIWPLTARLSPVPQALPPEEETLESRVERIAVCASDVTETGPPASTSMPITPA